MSMLILSLVLIPGRLNIGGEHIHLVGFVYL